MKPEGTNQKPRQAATATEWKGENTMKRFDTAAYIAPILDEIRSIYRPVYTPEALHALDCIVILQKRKNNDCLVIRTPDKGSFYYTGNGRSEAVKNLFSEIASYAEAAETTAGELDGWMYAEERRAMEAVRAALIDEYRKPRKTA